MARILAIDLGKFKSVACDYDTQTQQHTFMREKKRGQKRLIGNLIPGGPGSGAWGVMG